MFDILWTFRKFCMEYGDPAVMQQGSKFQNDSPIKKEAMDKCDFARQLVEDTFWMDYLYGHGPREVFYSWLVNNTSGLFCDMR